MQPQQRTKDQIKVYEGTGSLYQADQRRAVEYSATGRVIHIDPDTVYRLGSLLMDISKIANYFGLNKSKFMEICADHPEIEEHYLMGRSAGAERAAQKVYELVEEKNMVATIFQAKLAGFIEEDKKPVQIDESAPKVQIYIPDNGRDAPDDDE